MFQAHYTHDREHRFFFVVTNFGTDHGVFSMAAYTRLLCIYIPHSLSQTFDSPCWKTPNIHIPFPAVLFRLTLYFAVESRDAMVRETSCGSRIILWVGC